MFGVCVYANLIFHLQNNFINLKKQKKSFCFCSLVVFLVFIRKEALCKVSSRGIVSLHTHTELNIMKLTISKLNFFGLNEMHTENAYISQLNRLDFCVFKHLSVIISEFEKLSLSNVIWVGQIDIIYCASDQQIYGVMLPTYSLLKGDMAKQKVISELMLRWSWLIWNRCNSQKIILLPLWPKPWNYFR